jgi:lipopolysaccharide transport system permease protein
VVFSVFLGRVAKVPSTHGIPYPLFALSGLTMWIFFSAALQRSGESTVTSAELLSKVYFPRVLIPLAALGASLLDFLVALIVVIVALFVYGQPPGVEVLALPVIIVYAALTALGGGLWFSALSVRYRDVRQLLSFLLVAGMFITPIVYPLELIPHDLQPIYALNPLVGVLELYRWCLFGFLSAPALAMVVSLVTSVIALVSGAIYFRTGERTFADVI